MLIEKRDGSKGRLIITAMITNRSALSRIAAKWDKKEGMLNSPWENLIGGWCVDYYDKYGKAPGRQIVGLYESWASRVRDKETGKIVEKFLTSLSNDYARLKKSINADYVIDVAGEYFNRVRLKRLLEVVDGDVNSNKMDEAFARLSKFDRVQIGEGAGIDVFLDETEMDDTFATKRESIVEYPGALGKFFGDSLERDGFIVFEGPEKRGKTWWLIDLAYRAMCQRRKVAFFEIGDLSARQIKQRLYVRAAKIPSKPGTILYPTSIDYDKDNQEVLVEHKEKVFKRGLDAKATKAAVKKLMLETVKSRDSYFKLSVHPNDTLTMAGMRTIIQQWERQDWIPDVVVIDYADLLAPPPGFTDSRDQINSNFKKMRALSQEYHNLVVTATQTSAASYKAKTISREHFSEDKRKRAHPTGCIGINQDDEDKEKGVTSLNWIVRREDEYSNRKHCYAAGCLSLANPAIRSVMK